MDFPKGVAWAATGNFAILRLVGRWLRHGSGAIERVAWQLTRMRCSLIVRGIPEGHMLGDISLIWEIPGEGLGAGVTSVVLAAPPVRRSGPHVTIEVHRCTDDPWNSASDGVVRLAQRAEH